MTKRLPVSALQNKWNDNQDVDQSDLELEQSYNDTKMSGLVQNFFGSGVIIETPSPNIVFDTIETSLTETQAALEAAGNFDGTGLQPHKQPSDSILGNQLAVELTDSLVYGNKYVKVAIIGLSFDGELIMEKFMFHKNETQITSLHFAKVLTILTNNFKGNNNCSAFWDGRLVIREAKPFEMSLDSISVAQNLQPDLFWRDFRVADSTKTCLQVIQEGIGSSYDANKLNINITARGKRTLEPLDVTTNIGQKFKATTDNIQKISLLLGAVLDENATIDNQYNWTGSLIISVYALQTSTDNYCDVIPELYIDFEPESKPIAELSFTQQQLMDAGYVLTQISQPVDFVFSNSKIAYTGGLEIGKYYIITIRRSGDTNTGSIFVEYGDDLLNNARVSVYNGIWVDVAEEDLWFEVYSNSVKYATGQGYDNGLGIISEKTIVDQTNGATIDNTNRYNSFVDASNGIINTGIIEAVIQQSYSVQDEKTGNYIYSRKQYIPQFSFVTQTDLNTLKETSEPLTIGAAVDINPKITNIIRGSQNVIGLAKCNKFIIINPDPDLISAQLIGRKIQPNINYNFNYRIQKAVLCTDGYGDVNGDGVIDQTDIEQASLLIGESLLLTSTQTRIANGEIDPLAIIRADVNGDGYVTSADINLITNYVNRITNSFPAGTSFNHLELTLGQTVERKDGYYNCGCSYEPADSCGVECFYIQDGYSSCAADRLASYNDISQSERLYYGNHIQPNLISDNTLLDNVPFVPFTYQITYNNYWEPWLISVNSKVRELSASFTREVTQAAVSCEDKKLFNCSNVNETVVPFTELVNDFYIPGDLLVKGNLIRPDGSQIKSDIEVGIITLELPTLEFVEASLDVFRSFICDNGSGFTDKGYPAMKYSDCTTVQSEDLFNNKIRFDVSIQSYVPSLDGYSVVDGYGIIIDDIIAVYMDHNNGILRLTARDLAYNPMYNTMVTKIQIIANLKKSGWNNRVLVIPQNEISGLFV